MAVRQGGIGSSGGISRGDQSQNSVQIQKDDFHFEMMTISEFRFPVRDVCRLN
jgi:hypothetical protein